jgi:rhodanese-related sulfurtransferase
METRPLRERLVHHVRRLLAPPPTSREELRRLLDGAGAGAVVIDTREARDFEAGHVPGAINLPNDGQFPVGVLRAVPDKERRVVLYSMNRGCPVAYSAARKMELLGYVNVSVYEDGHDGWQSASKRNESPAGAPSRDNAMSPPAAATDSC